MMMMMGARPKLSHDEADIIMIKNVKKIVIMDGGRGDDGEREMRE